MERRKESGKKRNKNDRKKAEIKIGSLWRRRFFL